MIVLGLTGSIGMGKTAAARGFASLGIPVFDADAAVHELLAKGGGAASAVAERFPEALKAGVLERTALGAIVFDDPAALRHLESILHPLVCEQERRFKREAGLRWAWLVVLDIPLLFETGAEARCDYVAVVSASAAIQRARVLPRPGMTEAKYRAILNQQLSERAKRRRADFVISTSYGKRRALQQIRKIVRMLRTGRHPPSPGRRPVHGRRRPPK